MRNISLLLSLAGVCLLSACLKPDGGSVEIQTGTGSIVEQQVIQAGMPAKGDVRDEIHGKELWFAYGAVMGVNETNANGVATAHFLQDGTYVLGLQLNIEQPSSGSFYEGWLQTDSKESWISLGHLQTSLARSSLQTLKFSSEIDARDHLKIAVTREKDDGDPAPGEVIAEGVLKVTER